MRVIAQASRKLGHELLFSTSGSPDLRLFSTAGGLKQADHRQTKGTRPNPRFGAYSLVLPPTSPVKHAPALDIPIHVPRPEYAYHPKGIAKLPDGVQIKTSREIEAMRRAAKIAAEALRIAGRACVPGATTASIDAAAHDFIISQNAYPSPLRYYGFPRSVCTSVNNIMVHGIPDDTRPLENGDIVTVDVTVFVDGFHGDTAETFLVGDGVDEPGKKLVDVARLCRDAGIGVCAPGVSLGEIRRAVRYTADAGDEDQDADYDDDETTFEDDLVMEPGMVFTVEPVVCQGESAEYKWPDGWTTATIDGGRSAQFG
ncbi:Methionine aminopeptidase 1D, mitochondrial [Gonapodya sp. JEL0774]|nr:Methionine aminopeptidase 1D, mitochondrial [Gonapodya sp. JEL0774]